MSIKKSTAIVCKIVFFLLLAFTQANAQNFAPKKSDATHFVKATVNDKPFTSLQILAKSKLNSGKKEYIIIAVGELGRIEFKLNKELKVGTFTVNNIDKKSTMMYATPQGMPYITTKCSDATGSITITQFSETGMSGTFNFKGKYMLATCETAEKTTITNGSFKVNF